MSTVATTHDREGVRHEDSGRRPNRSRSGIGDRLTLARSVPMVPALLLLVAFMLGPIVYSVYLAFTDNAIRGDGAAETSFVG